jgi:hypothetical protein
MRTRIAIDPNVRVWGDKTYAGFEDVQGIPVVGGYVEVWESESGASGFGQVTAIDHDRGLVYLSVDWAALRAPAEVRDVPGGAGAAPAGLSFRMRLVADTEASWQLPGDTRGDAVSTSPEYANA